MKKQELRMEFDQYFGEVPASFSNRLEATLANLEEEKKMNQRTFPRALLIAALITILTLGTAVAATNGLDILGFFQNMNHMKPQEGAENTIERDLGHAETPTAILKIREAVYDGSALRAVLSVEAKEKDKYVPANYEDEEEPIYDRATRETVAEYAARTGRETLSVGCPDVSCVNAGAVSGTSTTMYDGDTMLVYWDWMLQGEQPEELEIYACLNKFDDEKDYGCTARLKKVEGVESAYALEDAAVGDVEFTGVTRRDTCFTTNLTLAYTSSAAADLMTWKSVDCAVYATQGGSYFHLQEDCSGMKGSEKMTSAQAADLGKLPCEICAGKNPWENENLTVYATQIGAFFHAQSDCMGMRNAEEITISEALEKGKSVCPFCIDIDVEPREHSWVLKGEGFSLSFTTMNNVGFWYVNGTDGERNYYVRGGDIYEADGTRCPFFAVSMEVGMIPEGELTLTRLDENGAEIGSVKLIPIR